MTNEALGKILSQHVDALEGEPGRWKFTVDGVPMLCLTDATHDRMRIVAPVTKVSEMTDQQNAQVMEANFHTALDARYATTGGMLFAAFLHPLSTLSPEEARSALRQVSQLARTFGSSYSSGELLFGR